MSVRGDVGGSSAAREPPFVDGDPLETVAPFQVVPVVALAVLDVGRLLEGDDGRPHAAAANWSSATSKGLHAAAAHRLVQARYSDRLRRESSPCTPR